MSEIELEIDGHVACIRLAAPERRNALTPEMAQELIAACNEVDAHDGVGAVVVMGKGGFFCAGAHRRTLADVGADPTAGDRYRDLSLIYDAFVRVGALRTPTVAAIRGGAVGAGFNLALATDLRVVSADARLLSGFLQLGIHPGGGHFVLAARQVGREAAAAMTLFGQPMSGERAAELGMSWEALPDDRVEERAMDLARQAGADPALAREFARSFRQELGPPAVSWPVAVDSERAVQMWSLRRKIERKGGS